MQAKLHDMRAVVEQIVEHCGRLNMYDCWVKTVVAGCLCLQAHDSMVNKVGITALPSLIHETLEEAWDNVMNVNARPVFLRCENTIAQMLNQEPHISEERGWIVNIASIAGLVSGAGTRKP